MRRRLERSISAEKRGSEGRLPQSDPLLLKMAARKRGFSRVEGGRQQAPPSTRSQRRNPMQTVRDNASRVKRFRELKATLRTNRQRLLVGLDIAQAEHVVHLRHAHTRVVTPALPIPNTTRGFAQLWARIQQAQRATGCREIVCGLEPTGTYHQAVAAFLERQGADVVLISSSVAYWNRRTQDGTWDKHDRKDAANCAELLEQGKVLFYSQPTGPIAELRHLVKLLRRARAELASCKARWRTTLRPALGPMGEPLPNRLPAERPAGGRPAPGVCAPADDPGHRADGGRDPPGGDRRHRVVHPVQPAPEARGPRHCAGPVGAVRGAGPDLEVWPRAPAVGALPSPPPGRADRCRPGPARGPPGQAARRPPPRGP